MASILDNVVVTAECLCKAHAFTTKVPTSKLPLLASACHCDSCRRTTGALYSIDAPWPEPRQNVDTTNLKKYPFSTNVTVLFCETCSTPLFWEFAKEPHELGVFTGALQNHNVNLVKIESHIFVADTIDGGATMWLRKPNVDGSEARRFKKRTNGEELPHDWPSASSLAGYEKQTPNAFLPIRCHCKGIEFRLHHGDYQGKTKEELPWFIDPKSYKPLANFDACNSCRLQSGIDLFHWTFTELVNISTAQDNDKASFPKTTFELKTAIDASDPTFGTLAYYQSSPDVQRYFCKVCSATVFYACDDRSDQVDVAVGLLEAPDGARAEGSLSWNFGGLIPHVKDMKGGWREAFSKLVSEEAEEWRIQREYPKNWRRIEQEKD